mgnify:CR=1 FL=1
MAVKGTSFHIQVAAWNTATRNYQAADAANVTLVLVLDGVEAAPTNSPSNLSNGQIDLELTNAEANHDMVKVTGTSTTPNVIIIPGAVAPKSLTSWDGNGSEKFEYWVEDSNGSPIEDVSVTITSDEEGLVVKAGPKDTDETGYTFFMLDPGTYWAHRSKSGKKFVPNPQQITVADE